MTKSTIFSIHPLETIPAILHKTICGNLVRYLLIVKMGLELCTDVVKQADRSPKVVALFSAANFSITN